MIRKDPKPLTPLGLWLQGLVLVQRCQTLLTEQPFLSSLVGEAWQGASGVWRSFLYPKNRRVVAP